jgi:uncharacterized membrane protein
VSFSWLSLQRHNSFSTNALDLGYIDQVVWNILHGRFLYSTIRVGMSDYSITYPPAAYHFQPILVLLSLLYLIYSRPETLLVLQSIILGLGALPVFWLARDRLDSGLGGLTFALSYLLLPAIGWASLTGFHSLSLVATFLLFAFYFLQKRSYLGFSVFALLALATREDASLFVAMMGLYALIVQKERKISIWTVVISVGWFLLTSLLIIPYYTYSELPEVFHQYKFLDGTYQSALMFAVLVICVIYGLGFLSKQLSQRLAISRRGISYTLLGLVLLLSGYYHFQAGASPLAKRYLRPEITAHRQIAQELIDLIPPNAPLSTQSNLLPHLSQRQKVYLFPAIKDAQYIFLDVTATPYPLEAEGVFQEATKVLNTGEFGVMAGRDGYILMKRDWKGSNLLPEEFYSFAKADLSEVRYPLSADFGQMLQFVGYDYQLLYEPNAQNSITITTYWQALKLLPKDYQLAFFLRKDGSANEKKYIGSTPTIFWYPARTWTVGTLIKVETSPLTIEGFRYIDVAVVESSGNDGVESPLAPLAGHEGRSLPIREGGRLQLLDLKKLPSPSRPHDSQIPSLPATVTPTPPIPSPTPSPNTCPLCGQVVQESGTLTFPPLAVKIDNAPGARPQSGLSEACIVYEHLTEWGVTRFTAIYLHQPPDNIGPIRSARLIDLDLARQYKAVFAHVGASPPIMERIKTLDLRDLDQFWYPYAYYRSSSRFAPHNVYSIAPRMLEIIQALGWQEPEILGHGFPFDEEPPQGGTPASHVEIPFSQYNPVVYQYDGGKGSYLRWMAGQPHLDTDNEQISVSNVVVEWANSWETDIIEDSQGARSLQFELTGEGTALIFRDGQVFPARWVRHDPDEMTKFLDEDGRPLPFKPGNIWFAIVPIGMEITTES